MEIGTVLLGSAVFIATLPYVFGPFKQKTSPHPGMKKSRVMDQPAFKADTRGERQATLLALRDLEFDFRTGKVADEDYQSLQAELLTKAASLTADVEAENAALEKLIEERRAKAATASATALACRACGAKVKPGDLFCPRCGVSQQTQCPSCGARQPAGARFCSQCGKATSTTSLR